MAVMKLATMRRRPDAPPGIVGIARLDRQTLRVAGRLHPGEIAIIDHVDLDRMAAEALVAAKPAAIINAQPSISGRYPNLGPQVIVSHGIPLLDNVGGEIFAAVKDGAKIRLHGDTVYVGNTPVVAGTVQDIVTVEQSMLDAKAGLASQLEAFAVNTGEFMNRERRLLIEGEGIPDVKTRFSGKHAVVVVRGHDYPQDRRGLKHYIREYKPVLVGVDGGADALLEAGLKPHLIVGDMDAVSDAALGTGAEVVVHAYPDGRMPGLARVQDLGIDAITFPTSGTSEDAAMLIADDKGAELVVAVGSSATLTEFLDRGRSGMASSFLTRLRLGAKVVDANTVARLYRNRISGIALLLLVVAAVIAVVATLVVADGNHTYLESLHRDWNNVVDWVQDKFS
jgi:uncharacterized membrane-anchored protein